LIQVAVPETADVAEATGTSLADVNRKSETGELPLLPSNVHFHGSPAATYEKPDGLSPK
jgi:hypothetical protein